MPRRPYVNHFFNKVEATSSCWIWKASLDKDGYGRFCNGRAHRWSYTVFREPIKKGFVIDHLCRLRKCVNPWHLEVVTPRENSKRGKSYIVLNTHCPKGHMFTVENTYTHPTKNYRICRHCRRLSMERYR